MKSKLDGARRVPADQVSSAPFRMLVTEPETVPDPVSISWTQGADERFAELRRERIAVVAYYLSEARGFVPGHEAEDWLAAQLQIDALDAGAFEG